MGGVKVLNLLDMVVCEPVIRDVAKTTLVGMSRVIEGPVVRVGNTVMRSMWFSSANFHAAFSSSALEAAYPYTYIHQLYFHNNNIFLLFPTQFHTTQQSLYHPKSILSD